MSQPPDPTGRTYRVVMLKDGLFAVEVTESGAIPWRISGFGSAPEALDWIQREREKRASPPLAGGAS